MDIRHDGVVLVFVDAKDTHIIAPFLKADDLDGWEARLGSMGSIQTRTSGAARMGDDNDKCGTPDKCHRNRCHSDLGLEPPS